MDLRELHAKNETRVARWHEDNVWEGTDWATALAGEMGEACNVVKKLRRAETGAINAGDPPVEELVEMLALECADVLIYLEILASHYGIDLGEATVTKFNQTSEKYDFPERLDG